MIIIRILFAIATFLIVSFGSLLIARFISRHDMKRSKEREQAVAWFVETIPATIFITLWCVEKGII